jgi:hypothetical protein
MTAVLEIEQVARTYGSGHTQVTALDGVSLNQRVAVVRRARLGDLILDGSMASACRALTRRNSAPQAGPTTIYHHPPRPLDRGAT